MFSRRSLELLGGGAVGAALATVVMGSWKSETERQRGGSLSGQPVQVSNQPENREDEPDIRYRQPSLEQQESGVAQNETDTAQQEAKDREWYKKNNVHFSVAKVSNQIYANSDPELPRDSLPKLRADWSRIRDVMASNGGGGVTASSSAPLHGMAVVEVVSEQDLTKNVQIQMNFDLSDTLIKRGEAFLKKLETGENQVRELFQVGADADGIDVGFMFHFQRSEEAGTDRLVSDDVDDAEGEAQDLSTLHYCQVCRRQKIKGLMHFCDTCGDNNVYST